MAAKRKIAVFSAGCAALFIIVLLYVAAAIFAPSRNLGLLYSGFGPA
jgi:hypothetical protein